MGAIMWTCHMFNVVDLTLHPGRPYMAVDFPLK